jgi:hypothetical protein
MSRFTIFMLFTMGAVFGAWLNDFSAESVGTVVVQAYAIGATFLLHWFSNGLAK